MWGTCMCRITGARATMVHRRATVLASSARSSAQLVPSSRVGRSTSLVYGLLSCTHVHPNPAFINARTPPPPSSPLLRVFSTLVPIILPFDCSFGLLCAAPRGRAGPPHNVPFPLTYHNHVPVFASPYFVHYAPLVARSPLGTSSSSSQARRKSKPVKNSSNSEQGVWAPE